MTQKQALTNILQSLNGTTLRRLFVCEWLEDINWHYECSKIQENFCKAELHNLGVMKNHKETDHPVILPFDRHDYDLAASRLLPGFVYIFGWGMDRTGWDSTGVGDSLIQEIETLINADL